MSSTIPTNRKASQALLELLLRQGPHSFRQGVPSTIEHFSEREPQYMSPNWLLVTSATQSRRPPESWLPSPSRKSSLPTRTRSPAPGESGEQVLAHLSSSLPSFSGCQQGPAAHACCQPPREHSWLCRLWLGAPKWQLEKSALI